MSVVISLEPFSQGQLMTALLTSQANKAARRPALHFQFRITGELFFPSRRMVAQRPTTGPDRSLSGGPQPRGAQPRDRRQAWGSDPSLPPYTPPPETLPSARDSEGDTRVLPQPKRRPVWKGRGALGTRGPRVETSWWGQWTGNTTQPAAQTTSPRPESKDPTAQLGLQEKREE